MILKSNFFNRDATIVAPESAGELLVREIDGEKFKYYKAKGVE